jgi:carboxymethylenebutenolidase
MSAPAVFSLTILALALGGGRAFADDDKGTVKPSTDSYLSAKHKINVTRFDPATPGPHPAILLLHGTDGAKENAETYHKVAGRLAAKGYIVFFVHYFDCFADQPKELTLFRDNVKDYLAKKKVNNAERLKAAFHDCLTIVCDGIGYVRTQPGVNKECVGLVGFSLGAFLALSAATQEDLKVAAVDDLFGGLPEEMQPRAKSLPPVLILHGDKDKIVPVAAASSLKELLEDNCVDHDSKVYAGVGHLFDDGKGGINWLAAADAEQRATAFLQRHLKRPDSKGEPSR